MKAGYDRQLNEQFRFRLTGSFYSMASGPNNTLYFGDRAGSHYFFVLENTLATADDNAWSGRFNPQFSDQVNTIMINPFLKWNGFEFFGTYELANGRMVTETGKRNASQVAADIVYRFPRASERFWIGGRYNSVTSKIPSQEEEIQINRITGSAGWFLTKNILVKGEYVRQVYRDFPANDIRSGGMIDGVMFQASVGF